jgi:hypothetical protein
MNPTNLLAFLYAIGEANIQNSAGLESLKIQLQCKPVDWKTIQERLDEILSSEDSTILKKIYNNFKTQLNTKEESLLELLLPIPTELIKNLETLSGVPIDDNDYETKIMDTEIGNHAEVILNSYDPCEMSKKLLKSLNETEE